MSIFGFLNKREMKRFIINKNFVLNPLFVLKNKAEKNLPKIRKLFRKKHKLYGIMRRSTKKETIRRLAEEIRLNEHKIQKAFNFVPSDSRFRFWEMPRCSCPVLDNLERWGLDHGFIHASDCLIHGE